MEIDLGRIDYNFIPVFNSVLKKYGPNISTVFGIIWRYCQHKKNFCFASHTTIGCQLNMSSKTIGRCIFKLIEDKLILDITPHEYNIKGQTRQYKVNIELLESMNDTSEN